MGAGHIPLEGAPLSDEGARALHGDGGAESLVAHPLRPDSSMALVIQVGDPVSGGVWNPQAPPAGINRFFHH